MNERTELYLFRHGRSLNNVQSHLIAGRSNHFPLVEEGFEQSRRLGESLLERGLFPDVIYSSPALRARQTAKTALSALGITTPFFEDERLQEQATGEWTGCVAADIFTEEMVRTIEASGKEFRSPGGESMNDVGKRTLDWANELEAGRRVFAFTHGGPIRCLPSYLYGWTHAQTYQTKPDNVSSTLLTKTPNSPWELQYLGRTLDEL